MCQGAITIDGNTVTRNIAWYTVAHASKFIRPGSIRIQSTARGDRTVALHEDEQRPGAFRAAVVENTNVLPNAAFLTPDGNIVMIVVNDTWQADSFTIQHNGRFASVSLPPGAAGTFIWKP